MKTYRIEMMDKRSYHEYMGGGYGYTITYYDVEAESKEQALIIAKEENPSYFLNEKYVREIDERKYTTSEKDRLIARIKELQEELKKFEKGA